MKKEAFAGLLLIIILVFSLLNINYIQKICEELTRIMDKASSDIDDENWETAAEAAHEAIELWNKKDTYTHIFLPHSRIDALTEEFYELLKAIEAQSAGEASASAEFLKDRIMNIPTAEGIRLGNIF